MTLKFKQQIKQHISNNATCFVLCFMDCKVHSLRQDLFRAFRNPSVFMSALLNLEQN